MTITTAQIRGARGILNWSQQDLAKKTGISATSIGSIENGQSRPREGTLLSIRKAFEDSGIEFIGMDGVRTRSGEVKTLSGKEGFWQFYEDIYTTVRDNPGEVSVSNVDERIFEKWLNPDNLEKHVARMQKIKDVTYKILISEGDTYYLATPDYAEYRWMPKDRFSSVPFYLYGKKMAILLFNTEPTVIIIEYPAVAEAYRIQFKSMWENSIEPPQQETK